MKKTMIVLSVLVAFCVASGAAYAFNCKIQSVDGGTLTIVCKSKDAKKLESGQQVKVKPKIEGC